MTASRERTKYQGIYRRGSKYVATIPYRDELGRRRVKWVTCKSLNEARRARRDGLKGLDEGIRPSDAGMALAAYLSEVWLPHVRQSCRPNTQRMYEGTIRRHIAPELGHIPLRDLDRVRIAKLYDSRQTNSIAGTCHRTLSAALGYAHRDLGIIAVNSCRSVSAPRVRRPEPRHLDVDEARRMLAAAEGSPIEATIILGLVGGMRIAEVCALTWGDIDLETGTVSVTKSSWGDTKNGKARTFTLPQPQIVRLRRSRVGQAERLLRGAVRQTENTTVIAKPDGSPMHPQSLARAFGRFVGEEGFDISFHGLRHTSAILLLTSGVDVKTAAGRLGHNPALLLATYAHYVPSADRQAADRLGVALAF